MISKYITSFHGKPVVNYAPGKATEPAKDVSYRLALEYDSGVAFAELFEQFLTEVPVGEVESLVIGPWGDEMFDDSVQMVLDLIVANAGKLTGLRALFVGEMTYEDCEMSWIKQGSYKGLLEAFPALEVLRIRGMQDLVIAPFEHAKLRELVIETGGLPLQIVQNLAQSKMPALEHLELWLGDDGYGFDGEASDYQQALTQIVAGCSLRYLGLRNSEIADELAKMLATQDWVGKLETLDLSLGTMGDEGARELLKSAAIKSLKALNLAHHYISAQMQAQLKALPLVVNLDDDQSADGEDRYVSVAE